MVAPLAPGVSYENMYPPSGGLAAEAHRATAPVADWNYYPYITDDVYAPIDSFMCAGNHFGLYGASDHYAMAAGSYDLYEEAPPSIIVSYEPEPLAIRHMKAMPALHARKSLNFMMELMLSTNCTSPFSSVLVEWLDMRDLGRLDVAMSDRRLRGMYHFALKSSVFRGKGRGVQEDQFLDWLLLRQVRVRSLHDDVVNRALQTLVRLRGLGDDQAAHSLFVSMLLASPSDCRVLAEYGWHLLTASQRGDNEYMFKAAIERAFEAAAYMPSECFAFGASLTAAIGEQAHGRCTLTLNRA